MYRISKSAKSYSGGIMRNPVITGEGTNYMAKRAIPLTIKMVD